MLCLTRTAWRAVTLLAALTLLALTGCQSRAPLPATDSTAHQVSDVPFFPQEDYQCGPAALATVLGSAGVQVSDQTLVDEVWLPERQGSLAIEMVAAARARERLVYPVRNQDQLFQSLEADLPVLVMQNLALPIRPRWHFAVVTGFENRGNTVILNTDTREAATMRWNRFVRTWARADYQGWVILPPGQLPPHARPLHLVQALEELTGSAGPAAAAPYWQQAATQWPQDYLLQFALGNHLWGREDTASAIQAWERAARARPEAFAPWHNLALAYAGQGCNDLAEGAWQHANQTDASRERLAQLRERLDATVPATATCPPDNL
ncbi:PA2778 family cysteine peptidase [Alcanivorax sp. JB21]|uniref:PA2778 family cysteine peptidase n=1 Tax=Alcanivorax limicola TaxID=2874102 RepID=UPI001CBC38DA|nr:PA2778 family cysteine peptidase [Alcanivorax limicola]MBZ2189595.1 PA2778 family cysteine peptidase [Alcanivorax limicola]